MFKKLLKYDFRALFKTWWIFAVIIISISFISGLLINVSLKEEDSILLLSIFASLSAAFTAFGMFAFCISPIIISSVRFYKHLFSDEGYLTFTLPVKLKHIINSKLISTSVLNILSIIVVFISAFIMLLMFDNGIIINLLKSILSDIAASFERSPLWTIVLILEILALIAVVSLISMIFVFICITLASIITKKHKVLASIGIYYGANNVISFFIQMITIIALPSLSVYLETIPEESILPYKCFFMLTILVLISIIFILLYILQYYMLDKKLNLS